MKMRRDSENIGPFIPVIAAIIALLMLVLTGHAADRRAFMENVPAQGNLNLNQHYIVSPLLHSDSGYPASPAEDQVFYRTTDQSLYIYDASAWLPIGGAGWVKGPASAVDGNFACFNGVTGKIIKDCLYGPTDFQPIDTTLTALAGYNTDGLLTQTAADTFTGRSLAAGSAKISISNANGVAGNPTIDAVEGNFTLSSIGGSVTDGQVPDTITLSNITQITSRSHTNLSDIGTNTHAQVDTHISATGTSVHGLGTMSTATATNYLAYADSRFFIGTFTRDMTTASGTQSVTGVGFQAKAVFLMGTQDGAVGQLSLGLDNGSTYRNVEDSHNSTASSWSLNNTQSISINQGSSNRYYGKITAFDSDGFTVTWTKVNSPTGTLTVYFMAFR